MNELLLKQLLTVQDVFWPVTMPHLLFWGDQEMVTAIFFPECAVVRWLVASYPGSSPAEKQGENLEDLIIAQ